MKPALAILGLVLGLSLGAGVSTLAAETAPAATPHLEVDALVDLGDVDRGRDATAVFELRNTGDAVLNILRAKPG